MASWPLGIVCIEDAIRPTGRRRGRSGWGWGGIDTDGGPVGRLTLELDNLPGGADGVGQAAGTGVDG